jgi:hypothetical protein
MLASIFWGSEYGRVPGKEGGIEVLAGLALCRQTAGSLLKNLKILPKSEFGEFTLIEK